ncbi:hypothetical protein [Planktothrix mougeotii]|nr:hypothetical protein [Planktothrix mougeotii]
MQNLFWTILKSKSSPNFIPDRNLHVKIMIGKPSTGFRATPSSG